MADSRGIRVRACAAEPPIRCCRRNGSGRSRASGPRSSRRVVGPSCADRETVNAQTCEPDRLTGAGQNMTNYGESCRKVLFDPVRIYRGNRMRLLVGKPCMPLLANTQAFERSGSPLSTRSICSGFSTIGTRRSGSSLSAYWGAAVPASTS